MSDAFWIGRLCEEFACLPSQALAEWRSAPVGFLEEIIEARQYAKAKRIADSAERKADIPTGGMFDLVKSIEFELAQREIDERRAAEGGRGDEGADRGSG